MTNASLRHFSALLLRESFNRFKGANVKSNVVHDRLDPESLSKQAEKLVQEFNTPPTSWRLFLRGRGSGVITASASQCHSLSFGSFSTTKTATASRLKKAADPRYQKNNLSSVQFIEAQIKAAVKRAKRFRKLTSTYSAPRQSRFHVGARATRT